MIPGTLLPPLYAYQARTVEEVKRAYLEGARRIVIVLPTGGGKTRVITAIVGGAIAKGRRVLILAHREELVMQLAASFAKLGVDVGVIMAGKAPRPLAPIQVASIQTLVARPEELPTDIDIVGVDECHHAVASTWAALLARFPRIELLLGLTATPERGDQRPLGEASGGVFQRMVIGATVAELQSTKRPDGHPVLVPCRVVGPARYQRELFRKPLDGLLEFGRGPGGKLRPSILFAASVEEARQIAADAAHFGIRAAAIDGKLHRDVRRDALAAFARRELDLLVNVFVLTEGFDAPGAEVCGVARSCSAASTWLQMIGRVLRSSPGTGKRDALLIDYKGHSYNFGLVEDPSRVYSLEGKAISLSQRMALRQCLSCGSVFAPCEKCPQCGAVLPKMATQQKVKLTPAQIIERGNITPLEQKRKYFDKLVHEARTKGWKPAAVIIRFQKVYGHRPPWRVEMRAA